MRIHTNTLTDTDMLVASAKAGVWFSTFGRRGSKSRDHAFEVILAGSSRRQQNGGEHKAATWDQWGVFLAELFAKDASVKCWAYADASEFEFKTANRFDDGWPTDAHGDHTFRYSGTPFQQECTKCSAVTRWGV